MNNPRIFLGMIYSGEGDFYASVDIINKQINVDVTHFIISNMSEKDAHNKLLTTWNECKYDYDLFVKIDADIVLRDKESLDRIWQNIRESNRVTHVQVLLHDYMTNDLIYGLNCYNSKAVINAIDHDLYCDYNVDAEHDNVLMRCIHDSKLVPVGYHSHRATHIQAFRHGICMTLKNRHEDIKKMFDIWVIDRDVLRGFALIGVKMAQKFSKTNHNYTDNFLHNAFTDAVITYEKQLDDIIKDK